MNTPMVFNHEGFQEAWFSVAKHLAENRWEAYNVVAHVAAVTNFHPTLHHSVETFARTAQVLGPKHVAYTIFPHNLYRHTGAAQALFDAYNRKGGLYERSQHRKARWGTYFRRMTQYSGRRGDENQLDNIIAAIKTRKTRCRAAYTIVIQYPGTETTQKMGGPCLNYLTVQIDPSPPTRLGMLAVYRNHDFLERAYGNYWGLCNLVKFLAHETGMNAGPLTCVSSHAFVAEKRAKFKRFLDTR